MKYLLLAIAVYVIWRILKKRTELPADPVPKHDKAPEKMVVCAHCGVHLPESDALFDQGLVFCSEAHRLAGRGPDA